MTTMKTLIPLLIISINSVAYAATIYIDDATVDLVTQLREYNGTTVLSHDASQLDSSMSGMASFTDTVANIAYYRVPVTGNAGDTVNFGIQVAGPNGLSSASHSWLTGTNVTRDIVLFNSGAVVQTIDLTTGPFETQPASVSSATGVAGDSFSNLSFSPTANFDLVLIRAEFWGAPSGSFNGNESKLFGVDASSVPEPSSAILLGLGGLVLAQRRRR